jgi:hypothetical protein
VSRIQKFNMVGAVVAIIVSTLTIAITVGAIPYKAGGLVKRMDICESKFGKLDKVADDVAYIRGWIDSRKENSE